MSMPGWPSRATLHPLVLPADQHYPPAFPGLCVSVTGSCSQPVASKRGTQHYWCLRDPQGDMPLSPLPPAVPLDVPPAPLVACWLLGRAGREAPCLQERNLCWRFGLDPALLIAVADVPLAWGGPGFGKV